MPVLRYQFIEHELLTTVLLYADHAGYPAGLPRLSAIFGEALPDLTNRELVDTLKRLQPDYLLLLKWSPEDDRFIRYPVEINNDQEFFYRGDFYVRHTPRADPYVQELRARFEKPNARVPRDTTMTEDKRRARFERWEKLGVDRIRADLIHAGGLRDVGGPPEVRQLAWEWVRMKEKRAAPQSAGESELTLIAESRLNELRDLASDRFDFRKLVRLCEEINIVYNQRCYFATAMLTRGLLDHVPPVFGKNTFSEVANNYREGGKSFKDCMRHLEDSVRKIADACLHMPIRKSETLPVAQQVNCRSELDMLLSELIRLMRL